MPNIPADQLTAGHVVTRVGRTDHSAITVTEIRRTPTSLVAVHGFNARDTTPRVMFRGLMPTALATIL